MNAGAGSPKPGPYPGVHRPQTAVVVKNESYFAGTPISVSIEVRAASAAEASTMLAGAVAQATAQLQVIA